MNKKLKIALIADPGIAVPPLLYGGIERIIYSLAEQYVKAGHEVHLFANVDSKCNGKLHIWTGKTTKSRIDVILNSLQLLKAHLQLNFDIIHNFGRLAYLIPLLPFKVLKVMSYQREPTLSLIKKVWQLSRKKSLHFTGCSNYIAEQIIPFASASTIYNFVDIDDYTANITIQKSDNLFFLGRIDPEKGAHIAINIAKHTNKNLIIAGNIPTSSQHYFDQQIAPHLDEQIHFIGPINDIQKNEYLGKSCAFLMPIEWEEPFGIVMVEAMACGTPVIGYKRGAVPEVVDQNITGFYGNSEHELINAILNIERIDRKLVRSAVEERFSAEVISAQYLNLFQLLRSNL